MLVKIFLMEDMFEQLNKSFNEALDPKLFAIIHGMQMMRVPFSQEEAEARSRTPLNLWLEDPKNYGYTRGSRSTI